MSRPVKKIQKQYCYRDYLKLPADKKYEIIDGTLYAMTPAPSVRHQRVLRKLFTRIANYLTDKFCEVFCSPLDVLLPEGNEETGDVKTVVQPGILVVCDRLKLAEKHCTGAPDFIIEIVSPSAPSIDYVKKLNLYEKHKVKEYWIVNYVHKEIMVYKLQENGEYDKPEIYKDREITASIFKDLTINLQDIFED